jgi:putative ABC transport system permease protein
MIAIIELDAIDLALAALLILVNALVSLLFRLELGRRLLLASLRAVVQLLLLGLLLRWVFELEAPGFIFLMMSVMAIVAGIEAVRRTDHRIAGAFPLTVGVVLVSSMAITLYGTQLVIGPDPWYTPQILIPILGMILGNTLNGISLGLETTLAGFRRDREQVEMLLAHGASRKEASRDVVRRAVRTGTIPILNSMVAAGLISIPGMMTGQILSGEPPLNAACYQIFILFCIAGGVALGTMGVVLGATRLVFDTRGRLRAERIHPRG